MTLPDLDPIIHQANRLRVLTLLFRNRDLAVRRLRDLLKLTDGNLASHLDKLAQAGYIRVGRVLAGVTFEVHAKITEKGNAAYRDYLAVLRAYVQASDPATGAPTTAPPPSNEPRPAPV